MAQASTKVTSIQSRQANRPPADVPNTLTAEADPTRDIRNLIEQLQDSSKDARARQEMAEEERDHLSQQLEKIQAEMEATAQVAKNIEAITLERDQLIEQGAKYGELIASLQHKLDVAERERVDVSKQRDELTRKTNALEKQSALVARQTEILVKEAVEAKARATEFHTLQANLEQEIAEARKQAQEATKTSADSQKQLHALKQARDAAAKQVLELKAKASLMEDQFAEVGYQLESANAKNAAASNEGKAELKKASEALAAAVSKYGAQAVELEKARKEAAEVVELRAENEELAAESEREIGEFTSRLDSLRSAHESELSVARQQHETALKERDLARERAQSMQRDVEQVRQEMLAVKSALAAAEAVAVERERREATLHETLRSLERSDEILRTRAMEADRRADAAAAEKAALVQSLDDARNSLLAAQNQIEYVIRDRDTLREKAAADALEREGALKDASLEIARVKSELDAVHPRLVEYAKLVDRFEHQRLDTIELSAQLENAQREIKEMGASLAEARLMVKNAERRAGMAGRPAVSLVSVPVPPKIEAVQPVVVDNSARRELVVSMRAAFQMFTRRPGDTTLLTELFTHAQNFAESSNSDGEKVLHRVSSSFVSLLGELHVVPEQVTPAMLRTVNQTIEYLAVLIKQPGLDRAVRLDSVRVYAVDDDPAICDSVSAAVKAVGLGIKTTAVPSEAISDLVGSRYDLVILDVHLPEIDGFELCTHIRNMALHTETPIVFLSGNASMENRVQSSLRGGNEFISKPFNFQELGLKALMLVSRSQLKIP